MRLTDRQALGHDSATSTGSDLLPSAPMGERWQRNLYVIWIATFASIAGGNLALPFLPLFINRDLGVEDPGAAAIWAGTANAAGGISMALMSPLWGVLADRHGRKAMLVRAQFALGFANTAAAFVVVPWQLVGVRGVQGVFSGVVGAARALVAGSVPRERVPYAMGLIQSAIFMGQTLGPTIGGVLGSMLGFRAALIGTGCVNTLAGLLAMFFIHEGQPAPSARREASKGGLRELTASRGVALLVLGLYLVSVSTMSIRPVLPLLLADIDPTDDVALTAGLSFAALGLAGAIASVAASRGASNMGLRLLMGLAALGAALCNLAVTFVTSATLAMVVLFGVGLCQGALASCVTSLLSLHTPATRQGTAFGVATSAQSLANASGPLLGGIIASVVGLRASFVGVSIVLVAICAVAALLPPTPAPSEPEEALA
ncbi:MAG: MFS transporter [Chloroflexi bacterium]|nr:MFS transporter [Chloroflexota bacterium]